LRISFGEDNEGKIVSISAEAYQAKGRFNKDAPAEAVRSLLEAKKMLVGLPVSAFFASSVSKTILEINSH